MTEAETWLRRRSVLVVTHTYTTGPSVEILDYLRPRARVVGFVAHPFSYCDDTRSSFRLFLDGRELRRSTAPPMRGPDPLFYAKDTALTLQYLLGGRQQYDLAIAADPLNVAALIPARHIGLIKRLVYWTIDYTPRRFEQPLLNAAYHAFDRLACYQSDLVWNSSVRIVEARRNARVPIPPERCAPQMTVPDGNHFERTPRLPMESIDRHAVAFLGHLVPKGGIELLVQCFPRVVAAIPRARLVVVGGGPLLESLRWTARDLGIGDHVVFHGNIPDHRQVEEILSGCAIAAAPYALDEGSVSVYSDVGKPKAYLAAGLPVVLTTVPEIAGTIAAAGAGAIVDYTDESLALGIIRLLSNESVLRTVRAAAVSLGATFAWTSVFDRAFSETIDHLMHR